jgi:hypothetical protein
MLVEAGELLLNVLLALPGESRRHGDALSGRSVTPRAVPDFSGLVGKRRGGAKNDRGYCYFLTDKFHR